MISFSQYKKLNEKFVEDSDPVKDLGIGQKNFTSADKLISYIIRNLPGILGTDEIPKDIIYPKGAQNLLNWDYYRKIDAHLSKFVKYDNENTDMEHYCPLDGVYIVNSLYDKLREMGYPKN